MSLERRLTNLERLTVAPVIGAATVTPGMADRAMSELSEWAQRKLAEAETMPTPIELPTLETLQAMWRARLARWLK